MPGRTAEPPKSTTRTSPESGDFSGYLARNLADAYRLAVMTLDDPIEAGTVVHDAIMSVWVAAGAGSTRDLDDAFRGRLEADVQAAIRASRTGAGAVALGPLEAAIAGLSPRVQLDLVRGFGPRASTAAGGVSGPEPGRNATEALRALRERLDAGDAATVRPADPEAQLRDLYASRDPGETPPLHLRLRLHQDGRDADAATAERARRERASGWRFVVSAFMAMVVLTLVVSLASVLGVRGSAAASGDPTGDPASPLTISGISVVQSGIAGEAVHVGATQRSLIVAFAASPQWHASSTECLADVMGTIDWLGNPTWIGARAGHADAIVGDPSSSSAYATGLGAYCQLGQYVSADGGLTWSSGSLPGAATSSPTWLTFDPAHPDSLFAYFPGVIYVSPDSGATWTSRKSTVTPLAFDLAGLLVGWTPGKLLESLDEGATWQEMISGPVDPPVTAGATANGVLIGAKDGLWWYPLTAAPSIIQPGRVFSIATLNDGAIVLGADSSGHPWLGTVDSTNPGIALASLPPEIASLQVSDGEVAANDSGAIVAFSGPSSAIARASFVY
jgi:hypothetical protein